MVVKELNSKMANKPASEADQSEDRLMGNFVKMKAESIIKGWFSLVVRRGHRSSP